MYDYHIHSNFSPDSKASMEDIAKTAIDRGISEICFTDHYEYAITDDWPHNDIILFDESKKAIDIVKNKYKDKLNIKCGVELGYHPTTTKKINDEIRKSKYLNTNLYRNFFVTRECLNRWAHFFLW